MKFLLLLSSLLSWSCRVEGQGNACVTPSGGEGKCVRIAQCQRVEVFESVRTLFTRRCKYQSRRDRWFHGLCCPVNSVTAAAESLGRKARNEIGRPLGADDFSRAMEMRVQDPPAQVRGMTMPSRFEGDIMGVEPSGMSQSTMTKFQNAIRSGEMLWAAGRIPYVISSDYSPDERATIARAVWGFHRSTCLRFASRTDEKDYIFIRKGEGCYSYVGRIGGQQEVSLGNGCVYVDTAQHELMHAVGFFHEQSREDRDDFVRIAWENIIPRKLHNFQKHDLNTVQHLRTPYDYRSVMHYGAYAFSSNGKPTIYVRRNGRDILNSRLGQTHRLSRIDVLKLNRLYNCPRKKCSPKKLQKLAFLLQP